MSQRNYTRLGHGASGVSRRALLQAGAGLAGGVLLPAGMVMPAFAVGISDKPPIGTWPAGSQGGTVNIGATVPRTGTYAVQGEDELKGMQLAVEHINEGNPLIKKIAPKVTKGVLGKKVNLVVANSAAKPNDAVQEQQPFINENKIVAMTGSTSSAVAVALNKFAEREKILYLAAISGSNDTTGKDCARYCFRQCFYGETAANAIGPVLVKAYGKNKKAAFMTPDYTYGHTVTKSVNDYPDQERRLDHGDQPGLAARHAGLQPVPDQHRQLRRRRHHQRQLGPRRGAVDPAGQAVRPHAEDEDGDPLPDPVPRQGSRGRSSPKASMPPPTSGGRWKTSIRWPRCSSRPSTRSTATSRNGAPTTPTCSSPSGRAWCRKPARSIRRTSSRTYEKGEKFDSTVGEVHFRPEDHQLVRPVIIVRGKAPKDMKNKEDYWEVLEVVPGAPLMQKPDAFGCKLGDYT